MSFEEDAELFLKEIEDLEPSELTKIQSRKWFFRVKKKLSERYSFDIDGYENNYVARLNAMEGEAELVLDVRETEAEVNAFVMENGDVIINEVVTWDWSA